MASLTDLPTTCRFAVLHVTDDEDETGVGSKAGTSAKGKDAADGTNATKAKKKRKKKKTRAKSNQVVISNCSFEKNDLHFVVKKELCKRWSCNTCKMQLVHNNPNKLENPFLFKPNSRIKEWIKCP